jgi:hypothetical protein
MSGFALTALLRNFVSRFRKNVPSGHKLRRNHRPKHKTVYIENRDTAQGRYQHDIIRDPRIVADQNGAYDIVY